MATHNLIRHHMFTLTVDGIVYRVREDVYANGVCEYWTKVGSWRSNCHANKSGLMEEIRNHCPLSPKNTKPIPVGIRRAKSEEPHQ